MIKELVDIMENGLDEDSRDLKKVDRGKVRQWARKVNEMMNAIQKPLEILTNEVIRVSSV